MSGPDLSNYVEVHERIEAFYKAHPEGSLQSSWSLHEIAGKPTIVVEAKAYRGADDERPGVGLASEPVPGNTPYTKDSELMNAETSAWGRALAALGFEVKRGIASGNEVRSRQGGGGNGSSANGKKGFLSAKQRNLFEKLLRDAGFNDDGIAEVSDWANSTMSGGRDQGISKAIDGLKDKGTRTEFADRLGKAAKEFAATLNTETPEYEPTDKDAGVSF